MALGLAASTALTLVFQRLAQLAWSKSQTRPLQFPTFVRAHAPWALPRKALPAAVLKVLRWEPKTARQKWGYVGLLPSPSRLPRLGGDCTAATGHELAPLAIYVGLNGRQYLLVPLAAEEMGKAALHFQPLGHR